MEGQGTGTNATQSIPATTGMTASNSGGSLVPPGAANPTVESRVPSGALGAGSRRESGVKSQESRVTSHELRDAAPASSIPPSLQPTPKPTVTPVAAEAETVDTDMAAEDAGLILPDLSDAQIFFLESDRYKASSETLVRDFAFTENDLIFLNEMDHAVLGGLINLSQYVEALRGEFPALNAEERDRLIGILLSARFVPFGTDLRPSAEEVARAVGIELKPWPYYRVYGKPLTFGGAAHEIALMSGIPLTSQSQERIRDAFISKLKGIRSDQQAAELLSRLPDQGGIGVNADVAATAVAAMADIERRAELMTEDEYAAWLNRRLHPVQEAAPAAAPVKETEEEKEIREIVARMPQAEADTATALASSIRAILERLSWHPDDAYLQRRLMNMVSTRLRDVRSRNEFFMKLMRDTKVGGLGLERKAAERVTEEVEKGYTEFRDTVAAEEKSKLDAQVLEQEKKIEARKRREAEERQRWYEEKVASKKRSEEEGKKVLERLRVVAKGQTTPVEHAIERKDRAREKAAFGDLVPAPTVRPPQAPAAPPAEPTAIRIAPKAPSAPKPPITPPEARKAPAMSVVKVSAKTADMRKAAVQQRPRLDDVVAVSGASSRPAGPLEQIGGMTLEQFRRLASSPEAAAKRIEELVAVLAQESFERRIAGIQAWQKSPLQMTYLKLVAEAFRSGKPVKELAAEKRTGVISLTPEELDAIVKLNGGLRL